MPEGTVWMDIAKTYKVRWVNEIYRIYYVNDSVTGPTLTTNRNLSENIPGRLHYCIYLLNNDLRYFFYSPTPFLKAAVTLSIMARLSGKSFSWGLGSLRSFPAKALVLMTLPASMLLYICGIWRGGGHGT